VLTLPATQALVVRGMSADDRADGDDADADDEDAASSVDLFAGASESTGAPRPVQGAEREGEGDWRRGGGGGG